MADLSKIGCSRPRRPRPAHDEACPRGGRRALGTHAPSRARSAGVLPIVKGQASVRRDDRKVATLGPGHYFGEMALLDRRPRSATVISDAEMTLLVLGQRQLNSVLDAVPALARRCWPPWPRALREADERRWLRSEDPPGPPPRPPRGRASASGARSPLIRSSQVCAARLPVRSSPGRRKSVIFSWDGRSSWRIPRHADSGRRRRRGRHRQLQVPPLRFSSAGVAATALASARRQRSPTPSARSRAPRRPGSHARPHRAGRMKLVEGVAYLVAQLAGAAAPICSTP